jgi:hypothetical protein
LSGKTVPQANFFTPSVAGIPSAPERTREELRALMNGDLGRRLDEAT